MSPRTEPPPSPSVWTSRAREVYERVRGLEGGERRAALDRECGEDWTLHAEVAGLLARQAHPSLPSGVRAPHGEGHGPTELEPDAIPGFRLGRLLGVGAAGAVYEAAQTSPRRTVALKVFRSPGRDERLRQRIAHEAEVLARLQHPNVAQVYAVHAGSAAHGDVPWIAMELVHGTPVDAWCRARTRSLRERVALLAAVADAVGHAHACGVVHRDLKPSNVLVTEAGVAKVVDFGVARTLGEAPAVGTLHTRDGDLVGTLAYMSLEQVEGVAAHVDARTDVHALGTLAFELIAGRLPRDPHWKSLPEWAAALRTPAPSLRDATDDDVPTDLALVVAKALEPDRDRRYATAQAFADDLRRYLAAEPVVARAPTTAYLVRSFVRRHRTLVGGALATVLALVGGIVVSLRFALESDAQRRRADREADEVRREAYRAQVGAASQGLAAGDVFGSRAALDRAPTPLRGWEWRHLDADIDRAARVVRFAQPLVRWKAAAPDAAHVAGGTDDGGAVVLDAGSGAVTLRIDGASRIERAVFLPDGRRLVVARHDGALEVVDVASGEAGVVAAVPNRGGECDTLAVSRDGRFVAESRRSRAPRVRIVDLETGTTSFLAAPDDWSWLGIAVDPTARRIAAAAAHGGILCADRDADAAFRTVAEHDHVALGVAFDPAGDRVVSWGEDRRAIVADVVLGTRHELFLHQQGVASAAWSDDGRQVATWASERILRLFDAVDGRLVRAIQVPDVEPNALVRVRPSGDLEVLDARSLHVWTAEPDTELDVLRGHRALAEGNRHPYLYDVAFSPDGRRLATAGWDGTVRIWSVATGRPLAVLEAEGSVKSVAWAPDGRAIVAIGRPQHVVRFDATTGRRTASVNDGCPRMEGGLAFTPDGAFLVTPDDAMGGVCLRDPVTLEKRTAGVGHGRVVYSVAVRGGEVATGFGDGGWDLRTLGALVPLATFEPHKRAVAAIAVSADGTLAASASDDGLARIADARTGVTRATLRGHVGRVYAVAFSPDGSRVATGGDDGTIRVHDVATGDELLVLRGHRAYVFSLRFSPDGTTIASASGDNTARLWSTVPLRARVARRDAVLAVEAAVEAVVDDAIADAATAEAAVAALEARADLDDVRRAAALDVALRKLAPVVGAPRAR